jgi:hypothetical protein
VSQTRQTFLANAPAKILSRAAKTLLGDGERFPLDMIVIWCAESQNTRR